MSVLQVSCKKTNMNINTITPAPISARINISDHLLVNRQYNPKPNTYIMMKPSGAEVIRTASLIINPVITSISHTGHNRILKSILAIVIRPPYHYLPSNPQAA